VKYVDGKKNEIILKKDKDRIKQWKREGKTI